MQSYTQCIIVFLDILGFKNMINTKAFEDIRHIFSNIMTENDFGIALSHATYDQNDTFGRYNMILSQLRLHIMSDSIVIAVPSGEPEALAVLIDVCDVIQEQLYQLNPPVFLRGAVAEGDFYLDEQLIFGKGLVDAYVAQENYAIYPRIILSDAVVEGKDVSVDHSKSLVKDEDGYYYINTVERYIHCETLEELYGSEQYHRLRQCIDANLRGYADSRVREKYIWLRKELKRLEKEIASKQGGL